jgi:hypothetical protein
MKFIYMVDGNVINADTIISIEPHGEDDSMIRLQGGRELVYRMMPHTLAREVTKAVNSLTDFVVGKKAETSAGWNGVERRSVG